MTLIYDLNYLALFFSMTQCRKQINNLVQTTHLFLIELIMLHSYKQREISGQQCTRIFLWEKQSPLWASSNSCYGCWLHSEVRFRNVAVVFAHKACLTVMLC